MKKSRLFFVCLMFCILCSACGKDKEQDIESTVSVSESVEEVKEAASVEEVAEPEPEPEPEPEAIVVNGFVISGDRLSVTGGSYEQDGKEGNGAEKIEWIVLEDNGDSLLLLSKKVLDMLPYGNSFDAVTWEQSKVREYLNNDFLNTAFSEEERSIISDYVTVYDYVEISEAIEASTETKEDGTVVETEAKDAEYEAVPAISDKVFLLSLEEVEKYFPENVKGDHESRSALVSDYAAMQGVFFVNEEGYELFGYKDKGLSEEVIGAGNWWLRDNGGKETEAMDVGATGIIRRTGHDVGSKKDGIRPAILIKINQ